MTAVTGSITTGLAGGLTADAVGVISSCIGATRQSRACSFRQASKLQGQILPLPEGFDDLVSSNRNRRQPKSTGIVITHKPSLTVVWGDEPMEMAVRACRTFLPFPGNPDCLLPPELRCNSKVPPYRLSARMRTPGGRCNATVCRIS